MNKLPKIKRFDFYEVIVPAHLGVISSKDINKPLHMLPVAGTPAWSKQFDELPKLLTKLTLDNGTVGIGEFYRDHNHEIIKSSAKTLLGLSLSDLNLSALPLGLYREYDGFECAIWDAYAKLKDLPLCHLLGGQYQDKVKIGAWSSHRNAEEIGPWAKQYQDQGFDCIKFKCDLEDEVVTWAKQIDQHAPGMEIILDPNQRWENIGETKKIIRGLEEVGNVFCLEDPIPRWMLQQYQELKNFSSIRIVLHNSLPYIYQGQRLHDLINSIQHLAADGYNFNAGLANFRRQDAIATAANIYFWHGSEVDLGVLEAMYVHQLAATTNGIWPSDIFGRMIREDDLLETPLEITPPFVKVPEGAGLGVNLNLNAIEKYKTTEYTIQ